MNIALWALQLLLALHTAMGAVWKWSHPSRRLPRSRRFPMPSGWSFWHRRSGGRRAASPCTRVAFRWRLPARRGLRHR